MFFAVFFAVSLMGEGTRHFAVPLTVCRVLRAVIELYGFEGVQS